MMKNKISFKRDGLTLVGNLFTPENFDDKLQYQAIIVEGSLTSVKEQMPETYAQKFANEGFIVLAFDYSHYGESEGKPRQLESPESKLKDLEAAVSYLISLNYVKSVGMVGVCTSAGNAAYLAASDPRIKATATVAGYLPDPALLENLFGKEKVESRREAAAIAKSKFEKTGEESIVTAYSETDTTAANFSPTVGAYDYYLNKERGGVPQWKNQLTHMSWETFQDFDPINKASLITVPTMVVHSDGCAFPDQAKKFYSNLKGEKELVWGDGTHFNYYDNPKQVDYAVENVTRFFKGNL
ncbi:hydrolase [Chryseobacterium sp. Leaf405]|nr:hydrolase [Chryseobacterium sp. Leaf405]